MAGYAVPPPQVSAPRMKMLKSSERRGKPQSRAANETIICPRSQWAITIDSFVICWRFDDSRLFKARPGLSPSCGNPRVSKRNGRQLHSAVFVQLMERFVPRLSFADSRKNAGKRTNPPLFSRVVAPVVHVRLPRRRPFAKQVARNNDSQAEARGNLYEIPSFILILLWATFALTNE